VTVSKILYSRTTGVETWITSDGRAYFVQLQETPDADLSTSELGLTDDDGQVSHGLLFCVREDWAE
jgi:hypothetical protein